MKKYIDCDEAVKFIKGRYSGFVENILTTLIEEEVPAADVRENKYGEWKPAPGGGHYCSQCGAPTLMDEYGNEVAMWFCGKCGADMRGRIIINENH